MRGPAGGEGRGLKSVAMELRRPAVRDESASPDSWSACSTELITGLGVGSGVRGSGEAVLGEGAVWLEGMALWLRWGEAVLGKEALWLKERALWLEWGEAVLRWGALRLRWGMEGLK